VRKEKKKKTAGTSRDKSYIGIKVQTSSSRKKVFLYWYFMLSGMSGTGTQPGGSIQNYSEENLPCHVAQTQRPNAQVQY
jgi:hypothetical protein